MAWINKLSLRVKIMAIALVAIIGFVINVGYSYLVTGDNKARLEKVQDVYFPVLERTDANIARLKEIVGLLDGAVSMAEMEMLNGADEARNLTETAFSEVAIYLPEAEDKVTALVEAFLAYYEVAKRLSASMIEGTVDSNQLRHSANEMTGLLQAYKNRLHAFRDAGYAQFAESIDTANNAAGNAIWLGIFIGICTALVVLIIAFTITAMISGNVNRVVSQLERIAAGDLTLRLGSGSQDEIGSLVTSSNTLVEKLHGTMTEVMGSISRVAAAAKQMHKVSDLASKGMQNQNSEIEHLVSAASEMATSAQEVIRISENAAAATQDAHSDASQGALLATNAIASIDKLQVSISHVGSVVNELDTESAKIETVLDVIRSVAEQTNLLALNAAIEAARAGEAGRGFAVVADEVRTLASRSQASTREIQNIIEQLQQRTRRAVSATQEARDCSIETEESVEGGAEALGRMAGHVSRINDMNAEIANAAYQQGTVAEEISGAINRISVVSQQTAEGANQSTSASEELERLAGQLHTLASQYQV